MRLIVDGRADGARNMAVDEALLRSAGERDAATLRLYLWDPPCLSFGRNQTARGRYDPAAATTRGIDVVRRPTGGRAVYHDRELTYSVTAPADLWGSLREAYCRINRAIATGLADLGVPVTCAAARASDRRAPAPDARACFRDPLPGEVTAAGRKLVGSAQWRDGGALLQHGSLLLHDDQRTAHQLQTQQDSEEPGATGAIGLSELLPRLPETDAIVDALARGFDREFGTAPVPDRTTPHEREAAERYVARYRDPSWTWRR